MVKTIVVGCKENFNKIKQYLTQYEYCNENDIIDNLGKWKSKKLIRYCENNDCEIIFATTTSLSDLVTNKLSSLTCKTYFIPEHAYVDIKDSNSFKENLFSFDIRKPCLVYVEFHVIDICNLNCSGCTHFSNIESDPCYPDLAQSA